MWFSGICCLKTRVLRDIVNSRRCYQIGSYPKAQPLSLINNMLWHKQVGYWCAHKSLRLTNSICICLMKVYMLRTYGTPLDIPHGTKSIVWGGIFARFVSCSSVSGDEGAFSHGGKRCSYVSAFQSPAILYCCFKIEIGLFSTYPMAHCMYDMRST